MAFLFSTIIFTRKNFPLLSVICLLMVFTVTSADGLDTTESQLWDAIRDLAPYRDMLMRSGDNVTEHKRTTKATLEKLQEKVVSQNLTEMYVQFRHEKLENLQKEVLPQNLTEILVQRLPFRPISRDSDKFTFQESACIACGYSLGFLLAACVDCAFPPH